MERIISLSNERISVDISSFGAQLKSIKKDDVEFLKTEKTPEWDDSAPVLFPICGCLKDDKYIYDGKEYFMEGHGFASLKEFEVETANSEKAVFLLSSSNETLKIYPFEFEFRVKYEIKEDKLFISYDVLNKGENDMYFSVGSHEGYVCPEGIEDYSIIFDENEDLEISLLDGVLLNGEKKMLIENTKELPLKYEYYTFVDTLVFENLKSRGLTLLNRNTKGAVELDFSGCDNLLIWTAPGEKYICIEPWAGLPDFIDSNYDITKKPGIIKLGKNKKYTKTHSIKFKNGGNSR